MTTAIAQVLLLAAGLGLSILVLILGWGLTPRSWWWILGGSVGLRSLLALSEAIVRIERRRR